MNDTKITKKNGNQCSEKFKTITLNTYKYLL